MNSCNKGKRGERKVVNILNERFKTKQFARVPSSGAIGTANTGLSKEAQKSLSGDLLGPVLWKFSVEIKFGYNLDFIYLLTEKSSNDRKMFQEFCEQACEDASRIKGRIPMVIYAKDRRELIVSIPIKGHDRQNQVKKIIEKENNLMIVNFDLEKFTKWGKWGIFSLERLLLQENSFFFDEEK